MNPTIPQAISGAARLASRPALMALGTCAGLVTAATAALWFHYGTAVFTETIIAGISACF
ncbi:MAG TPA: hypothetical protein VGH49_09065 [Xanthobacteraceae bacterium]|jgi:hypothetical protein